MDVANVQKQFSAIFLVAGLVVERDSANAVRDNG